MDNIIYDYKFKARYPPEFFAEIKPKQQKTDHFLHVQL